MKKIFLILSVALSNLASAAPQLTQNEINAINYVLDYGYWHHLVDNTYMESDFGKAVAEETYPTFYDEYGLPKPWAYESAYSLRTAFKDNSIAATSKFRDSAFLVGGVIKKAKQIDKDTYSVDLGYYDNPYTQVKLFLPATDYTRKVLEEIEIENVSFWSCRSFQKEVFSVPILDGCENATYAIYHILNDRKKQAIRLIQNGKTNEITNYHLKNIIAKAIVFASTTKCTSNSKCRNKYGETRFRTRDGERYYLYAEDLYDFVLPKHIKARLVSLGLYNELSDKLN